MLQEAGILGVYAPLLGSGYYWIGGDTNADEAVEERKKHAQVIKSFGLTVAEEGLHSNNIHSLFELLKSAILLSTDDQAPGYMAYVPSGGTYIAAVADFIAAACNRYVTIYSAAPALASIEEECIQWMCRDIVGYDAQVTHRRRMHTMDV